MISEAVFGSQYVETVVPLVVWSIGCWVAGVAYAAYRAVGWVERIRTWANTVDLEDCSFSGAPLVGAADHEGNGS